MFILVIYDELDEIIEVVQPIFFCLFYYHKMKRVIKSHVWKCCMKKTQKNFGVSFLVLFSTKKKRSWLNLAVSILGVSFVSKFLVGSNQEWIHQLVSVYKPNKINKEQSKTSHSTELFCVCVTINPISECRISQIWFYIVIKDFDCHRWYRTTLIISLLKAIFIVENSPFLTFSLTWFSYINSRPK